MQIVKIDVKDLFFFPVSIEEQPKKAKKKHNKSSSLLSGRHDISSQVDISLLISDANLY